MLLNVKPGILTANFAGNNQIRAFLSGVYNLKLTSTGNYLTVGS
jgi:hypothetical protein